MTGRFRIQASDATHVGHVRSQNEDSFASAPEAGVWLVADGMGGHTDGKFASQTIADTVSRAIRDTGGDEMWRTVANAIHEANRNIRARAGDLDQQIGSTVVALVVNDAEFVVLWAGDSRAYLLRGGELIRLTRDHTQVEMMVERGLLRPEEAADHPMKHVLARAVGVEDWLELDALRDTIVARDVFLLCSDGLYGVVEEEAIAAILREDGGAASERLIAAALAAGAPDNVTVTLVALNEPTLLVLGGAET